MDGPERQSDNQTDKQTARQSDNQTDRPTDRQSGRQTDRQSDKQTDWQTDRQTNRQTGRQTLHQTKPREHTSSYHPLLCTSKLETTTQTGIHFLIKSEQNQNVYQIISLCLIPSTCLQIPFRLVSPEDSESFSIFSHFVSL